MKNLLKKLKGFRTILLSFGVALLGYLSTLDIVDVRGYAAMFVSDEKVLGAVMAVLGVLFMVMRFVTTTGVLSSDDEEE